MGGMFIPSPGDVHVNTPLTNISLAYLQEPDQFIASRAFPIIPVTKQSDRYYVYNKGDFFRDEMQKRDAGTEAATSGYRLDNTPNYFADPWALKKPVPDQIRANADAVLNMDMDATYFLTQKALIRREKIWASNAFATGKWGTDVTGVSSAPNSVQFLQWNDPSSTPIEDIRAGKLVIKQNTGYQANVLVISETVWAKLQDHPDIVDRVKAGQTPGGPAMVTRQAVAAILEIDEILVMGAVENTAGDGQATGTFAFIGGKAALLMHRTPRPGLMIPTAGYTFAWTGLFGAGAEGNRIKRYRWEIIASDLIECEMAFDLKITATDMGYFFASAVA